VPAAPKRSNALLDVGNIITWARQFESGRLLSDLVNAAYGLTPDEVALMWATAPPRMPIAPRNATRDRIPRLAISRASIAQHAAKEIGQEVGQDLLLFEAVCATRREKLGPMAQLRRGGLDAVGQVEGRQVRAKNIGSEERFGFERQGSSVVSCPWPVVRGQLSVASCPWPVVSCQLSVAASCDAESISDRRRRKNRCPVGNFEPRTCNSDHRTQNFQLPTLDFGLWTSSPPSPFIRRFSFPPPENYEILKYAVFLRLAQICANRGPKLMPPPPRPHHEGRGAGQIMAKGGTCCTRQIGPSQSAGRTKGSGETVDDRRGTKRRLRRRRPKR
jgi:hypothetical protein